MIKHHDRQNLNDGSSGFAHIFAILGVVLIGIVALALAALPKITGYSVDWQALLNLETPIFITNYKVVEIERGCFENNSLPSWHDVDVWSVSEERVYGRTVDPVISKLKSNGCDVNIFYKSMDEYRKKQERQPTAATDNPTPSTSDASEWNTYIDNTHNFSFEYPSDWLVEKTGNLEDYYVLGLLPKIVRQNDYSASYFINIHSYVSPSLKEYFNTYSCGQDADCYRYTTDAVLGGYPAKKAEYTLLGSRIRRVATKKEGRVYGISMWQIEQNESISEVDIDEDQIYEHIVSTFEFTEQ